MENLLTLREASNQTGITIPVFYHYRRRGEINFQEKPYRGRYGQLNFIDNPNLKIAVALYKRNLHKEKKVSNVDAKCPYCGEMFKIKWDREIKPPKYPIRIFCNAHRYIRDEIGAGIDPQYGSIYCC